MTPQDFIDTWRKVELKERSASQSHFNALCDLLGLVKPIEAGLTQLRQYTSALDNLPLPIV